MVYFGEMKCLLVEDVPKELMRQVKLQAASEDRTMKKWIIEALKEKLRKSDKTRVWDPK